MLELQLTRCHHVIMSSLINPMNDLNQAVIMRSKLRQYIKITERPLIDQEYSYSELTEGFKTKVLPKKLISPRIIHWLAQQFVFYQLAKSTNFDDLQCSLQLSMKKNIPFLDQPPEAEIGIFGIDEETTENAIQQWFFSFWLRYLENHRPKKN